MIKNLKLIAAISIISGIISTDISAAETPSTQETIASDAYLGMSITTIGDMKMEELRALKDFLVLCNSLFDDRATIYCDNARNSYLFEYDTDRYIDRLVWSIHSTAMLMKANERTGAKLDEKTLNRLFHVQQELIGATRARFAVLRGNSSHQGP